MTDLEKLTLLMDEHTARAVRLGYALGFTHDAWRTLESDLPRDAPEYRALETLGITGR